MLRNQCSAFRGTCYPSRSGCTENNTKNQQMKSNQLTKVLHSTKRKQKKKKRKEGKGTKEERSREEKGGEEG